MNDFRLPDLPNAGYSTTREKHLSDDIQEFMRDCERNRLRLLTIVIEGKDHWRKVARDIWATWRIGEDHQLLDSIYDYFCLQAVRPGVQRMLLDARHNPAKWRDIMRVVMPHLERERETMRLAQKFGVH